MRARLHRGWLGLPRGTIVVGEQAEQAIADFVADVCDDEPVTFDIENWSGDILTISTGVSASGDSTDGNEASDDEHD